MTKATALLNGRDFALPDDTLFAFREVCGHRLILNSKAKLNGSDVNYVLGEVINSVPVPKVRA